MKNTPHVGQAPFWKGFWPSMAVLVVILAFLFRDSFKTDFAHASNDGPLGSLMSKSLAVPGVLSGYWADGSWVGMNGSVLPTSITFGLLWLLGPIGFAKFYPPITLLLLGASAWIFFRTLKLSPRLCLVATLAAALNMNFFSNTCWGLGTRSLTLMSAFLALAALNTRRKGNPWLNAALAGLCVGIGVIEGMDNGAIFSLFIAAYVLFQSFVEETALPRRLVSCVRLGVVGICAAFLAVQVLNTLFSSILSGPPAKAASAAAPLTAEEKKAEDEKKWVFASMWSLPQTEMLRLIIPGIFGYRMDTPDGGEYWGRVGEYWAMPDGPQRRASRSSGAGEYAGVLVVLVGLWALFHAWRGSAGPKPVFEARERRYIFFWGGMFVLGMLFSWGYHAPFYKWMVYPLPYFSNIRNPMKFMHPGHMALIILFGYGLLGLSRCYLEAALVNAGSFSERFKNWRAKALPFERRWFQMSIALAVLSVVAFLAYSNARGGLIRHLHELGFPEESQAAAIAKFSAREVGMFVVFLLASVAVVTLIQIGMFSGKRATAGVILISVLLTIDLTRADRPWIRHYNYAEQYASNPVIDALAREPWLHRAAVFPAAMMSVPQINLINQVWYRASWLQYHCQYYNIQSLDMAQDPRPSAEKTNYMGRLSRSGARLWELTNTRYLLGAAGPFVDALNQQLDPVRHSFRQHTAFDFPKIRAGDLTVQTNTTGPWALLEFGGALPRAKLFTDWQVITNDERTLDILGNPSFDPHKILLVDAVVPTPPAGDTNAAPGAVEFTSYASKHIELQATAAAPSILLLNDQFDRDWSVTVDGKPEQLLRCNFLMRGVQVPAGSHRVIFHFQPLLLWRHISYGAVIFGVLLCVWLAVSKQRLEPASGVGTAT